MIKAVSDSSLTEFKYKTEDVEIKMGKGQKTSGAVVVQSDVPQTAMPAAASQPVQGQASGAVSAETDNEVSGKYVTSPLLELSMQLLQRMRIISWKSATR